MVDTRYDPPKIPTFTTGLLRMSESGKYEGKEYFALPYYKQPKKREVPKDKKEKPAKKDPDHEIDFVA
jgi:hypothetical protein